MKAGKLTPDILGLSAILTVTMTKIGEVIKSMEEADLRGKVIVGGLPVTADFVESIGLDHCAANEIEEVKKCTDWVSLRGAGKNG